MEKGPLYILIYQKMLVYSLQNNSKIYFDNVEDSFEEEIALVIDEDVEDVKETLLFLKRTKKQRILSLLILRKIKAILLLLKKLKTMISFYL